MACVECLFQSILTEFCEKRLVIFPRRLRDEELFQPQGSEHSSWPHVTLVLPHCLPQGKAVTQPSGCTGTLLGGTPFFKETCLSPLLFDQVKGLVSFYAHAQETESC